MENNTAILRTRVNGSLLSQCIGKTVSLTGNVIKTQPNGRAFDIQTTDKHVVTATLQEPLYEPLSGLVEVHGVTQGKSSIACSYFLVFPQELAETFNEEIHNEACILMNNVANPWK